MLTKKNKRMVRKMKKYIKTFPLTEKEIDQMIEDITVMKILKQYWESRFMNFVMI